MTRTEMLSALVDCGWGSDIARVIVARRGVHALSDECLRQAWEIVQRLQGLDSEAAEGEG